MKSSIIVDILTLLLIFVNSYLNYKKNKKATGFIVFSLTYGIYYSIIPIMYKVVKIVEYDFTILYSIADKNNEIFSTSFLCFFIYLLFAFIYSFTFNQSKPKEETNLYNVNGNSLLQISNRLTFGGVITSVIGLVSFIIILRSMGGINNFLKLGWMVRSSNIDSSHLIDGNTKMFITGMKFIMISPFLFFVSNKIRKRKLHKLLFVLMTIVSILALIFYSGRLALLSFLGTFIIYIIFTKFKHPIIWIVLSIIPTLVLVFVFDNLLSNNVNGMLSSNINFYKYFIENFSYPFINVVNRGDLLNYIGPRMGLDYTIFIVNIIPYAILNKVGLNKITSLTTFITNYYSNSLSRSQYFGGIPADIITVGYMQLGLAGLILTIVLFAMFLKKLDNMLIWKFRSNVFYLASLRVTLSIFSIVGNFNFDVIFKETLDIVILIAIFIFVSSKRYGNDLG